MVGAIVPVHWWCPNPRTPDIARDNHLLERPGDRETHYRGGGGAHAQRRSAQCLSYLVDVHLHTAQTTPATEVLDVDSEHLPCYDESQFLQTPDPNDGMWMTDHSSISSLQVPACRATDWQLRG